MSSLFHYSPPAFWFYSEEDWIEGFFSPWLPSLRIIGRHFSPSLPVTSSSSCTTASLHGFRCWSTQGMDWMPEKLVPWDFWAFWPASQHPRFGVSLRIALDTESWSWPVVLEWLQPFKLFCVLRHGSKITLDDSCIVALWWSCTPWPVATTMVNWKVLQWEPWSDLTGKLHLVGSGCGVLSHGELLILPWDIFWMSNTAICSCCLWGMPLVPCWPYCLSACFSVQSGLMKGRVPRLRQNQRQLRHNRLCRKCQRPQSWKLSRLFAPDLTWSLGCYVPRHRLWACNMSRSFFFFTCKSASIPLIFWWASAWRLPSCLKSPSLHLVKNSCPSLGQPFWLPLQWEVLWSEYSATRLSQVPGGCCSWSHYMVSPTAALRWQPCTIWTNMCPCIWYQQLKALCHLLQQLALHLELCLGGGSWICQMAVWSFSEQTAWSCPPSSCFSFSASWNAARRETPSHYWPHKEQASASRDHPWTNRTQRFAGKRCASRSAAVSDSYIVYIHHLVCLLAIVTSSMTARTFISS